MKLLFNSRVKEHIHRINRLVHLSDDRHISTTSLVHLGAMRYLQSVSVQQLMQNDFLVVDVIMQSMALRQLSEVLLGSTVWFDVTNGASFVSHYDEGLVFDSIRSVVKQISYALSPDPTQSIRVSSYYAVAMSLSASSAASHVSMANEDEVLVVLWLNPLSSSGEGSEKENDGLRIYDDVATATLFSQGVSIYPSAHVDFLSRTGNLAIDLESRCGIEHSEYVARKANRMVIVRGRRPVVFVTPGPPPAEDAEDEEEEQSFSQSSMIALVVKLLIDEE